MSKIKDFITISRLRILMATPAQPLLGIVFAANSLLDFINIYLVHFMILYFISILFAVHINCYCDRDLDIKYKKHLANAVDGLGKPLIRKILVVETCLIFIFSIYLIWVGYFIVGLNSIIGWGISTSYSALPLRIKKRGFLSAFPIIIGLFMFPFINGWLMISNYITLFGILFLIGYILLNQGMNLINTAEDYDEDLSLGVKTWAHVFGLKRTFNISIVFISTGGACCIIGLLMKLLIIDLFLYNTALSASFIVLSVYFILKTINDIYFVSRQEDLKKAAKENSYKMPLWFASTRYPMLIAAFCMLLPF
ncbi:MAG: UbiA family prenyltransferase [Candidatus Helarchaeota archaeon]